jgi:hypothetical protein
VPVLYLRIADKKKLNFDAPQQVCSVSNSFNACWLTYSSSAGKRNSHSHAEEHSKMKNAFRTLSFVFLGAALMVPVAIRTNAAPQDDHRDDKKQVRVYDRSHKDYHNWDDNEDRSYRRYLGDQHKDYREFKTESQRTDGLLELAL